MHLCFGNYKGRSMGPKSIAPMLPDFMDMAVDERHSEMTSLNFLEQKLANVVTGAKLVRAGLLITTFPANM